MIKTGIPTILDCGWRVYLSGPMTGIEDHNYPSFTDATTHLRELGFIVYNPAENFGGVKGLPRKEYMRVDLIHLLQAELLILLPSWETSDGATLEKRIADELELDIYEYCSIDCSFSKLGTRKEDASC